MDTRWVDWIQVVAGGHWVWVHPLEPPPSYPQLRESLGLRRWPQTVCGRVRCRSPLHGPEWSGGGVGFGS